MEDSKRCNGKCGKVLPLTDFYKTNNKVGRATICKNCKMGHRRTKYGLLTVIYNRQVHISKRRSHVPPNYTRNEFLERYIKDPIFVATHERWVKSEYLQDLSPSFDRLDDDISYSFDNLRVVTWKENRDKYHQDLKYRINTKVCKKVSQFDLYGNFIKEYISILDAGIMIGSNRSNINGCCSTNRKGCKTANGFIWQYSKDCTDNKLPKPLNEYVVNIDQFDIDGNFIKRFINISHVKKELNLSATKDITKCINGKTKTSHGYKWEKSYSDTQMV